MPDPTIIIGSLNNEELKKNITDLVKAVEEGTTTMKTSFDNTINGMKRKLQELAQTKVDFGSNLDKQAVDIKKAIDVTNKQVRPELAQKSARESYYAFVEGFKTQASNIATQIKNAEDALKASIQERVDNLNAKLTTAKQKLNELRVELERQRMEAEKTGNYSNYNRAEQQIEYTLKHIQELEREIANTPNTFGQQKADIEALRQKREQILGIMKEEVVVQQQVSQSTQQQSLAEKQLSEEIKQQAQAIRNNKQFQQDGMILLGDSVVYAKSKLSIEEQLLQIQRAQTSEMSRQARSSQEYSDAIRQSAESLRQQFMYGKSQSINVGGQMIYRDSSDVSIEQQLSTLVANRTKDFNLQQAVVKGIQEDERKISEELEKQSATINKQSTAKKPMSFTAYDDLRQAIAHVLGVEEQAVKLADTETASYKQLSATLKQLKTAYESLTASERNSDQGKALLASIHEVETAIKKIREEEKRPVNLQNIIAFNPRSIDEIIEKIRQLQSYKRGINITKPGADSEIRKVDEEIKKLNKDLEKYTQNTRRSGEMSNALARSWNYMKNRLAFYFTVGASTQFVKTLIDIRSQYEMNEKALGILIGSAEYGTKVFNELSQMALVSPYTLIELSAAAKQLTAYDIAARDVVDTTRRLADMAAAVGIPMERLTYALGQIKAYGYLNSRDARMFANAGIPLVKELSNYYTELEGKMVSVGDIYDRIKKKAIGFEDVMSVVTKMTDEGGRFFDFQAKMADTLKVRLANLTLAWNNMLNDIGKSNQGVLVTGIGLLKELFLRWKDINKAVENIIIPFGIVKALQLAYWFAVRGTTQAMALETVVGTRLANVFRSIGASLRTIIASPTTWFVVAGAAIAGLVMELLRGNEAMQEFNKSLRDGASEGLKTIEDYFNRVSELRSSLYTYETDDTGAQTKRTRKPNNIDESEAKKAWEEMQEEIVLASSASDMFIGQLLQIENVSERLRVGFALMDDIKAVDTAISQISDDTIELTRNWSAWWNLVLLPDGLIQNVKDYAKSIKEVKKEEKERANWDFGASGIDYATAKINAESQALKKLKKDLDVTTKSIDEFISAQGFSDNPTQVIEVYDKMINKLVTDNQLSPEEAFAMQKAVEEAKSQAVREAIDARIEYERGKLEAAYNQNERNEINHRIKTLEEQKKIYAKNLDDSRLYWDDFTKYIKDRHISEVRDMYEKAKADGKQNIDFQSKEWNAAVKRWVENYARSHKMSYDEAFNYLRRWVQNANLWSIFIKLNISTEDGKSVYDTLTELDSKIDTADSTIKRLKKRIDEISAIPFVARTAQQIDDLANAEKELATAEEDKRKAEERGGHGKQEEKDAKAAAKEAAKKQKADAAAAKKQRAAELKAQREAESELQKTLKNELSLIDKIRSAYKDLIKEGATHADAIKGATSGYAQSVKAINDVFAKWGIAAFNPSKFAGLSNPRELIELLQAQLNKIMSTGRAKPAEIQELQVKIQTLKLDATKYDLKKITDGLNNELDKLKDEYEFGLEVDDNPELGEMFADMLNIDMDTIPRTFSEVFDKANKIAKEKLSQLGVFVQDFDFLKTEINRDDTGFWKGLDFESEAVKSLLKWQDVFKDMFKKNLVATEEMLDDYVSKYGNYADKIAEIESNRLTKIKKLNEAYYTAEMRARSDYVSKRNAIEKGAEMEKGQAKFDEFKNTQLYISMFENLEYVSKATLETMKEKLVELKKEMGTLTPEQLKQVVEQFEKIDNELIRRNPFKGLVKSAKDYIKAIGKDGKVAQRNFVLRQRQYDYEVGVLAKKKEQLEQTKAENPLDKKRIEILEKEIALQQAIVDKVKEQLEAAEKLNQKYNLMRRLFKEQESEIAKILNTIAANLQSLSELRDILRDTFGVELGSNLDATIDGLAQVGDGISNVVSAAQSGNVVGVVNGVLKTAAGLGDAVASIFGDGAARTKRINKEINKSVDAVRLLNMAYKELERTVSKALGAEETEARKMSIANKEAELAEIERQLALEKSKRSKDKDSDAIKQYEETIQDLKYEIADLKEGIVTNLLGSDVKAAAEEFVDTWVNAWKSGETTLDAIQEKMDDMIFNLIKKAATSKIVANLLQPLYEAVDTFTQETSEGGANITENEVKALAELSKVLGVDIDNALGAYYGYLEQLGAITESGKSLSALQQGIQSITEDTAGALEAYMNSVSQQVYFHSEILAQIRDMMLTYNNDVQVATIGQILLQLQASYQVQMTIQSTLEGWSSPNGQSVRVEMI